MKVKFFLFVIIISICFGFCQSISLWTSWEDEGFYREIAQNYYEETGIEVLITNFPKISEKINLSLKTDDLPDISMISDNMISSLYYSDKTVALTIEEMNKVGNFKEKDIEGFSYLDKILGIPFYSDENAAIVNSDLFDEMNVELPPENFTFDYLNDASETFKENGKNIIGWEFFYPFILYSYIEAYGGLIQDDNPTFNIEENKIVLKEIKDLFDEDVAVRLERGIQPDKFLNDDVGIILQGTFILPLLENKNFKAYSLPKFDSDINIPTLIDAKGFSLFNIDKKELCLDFIKYILENGDEFCINNIKVPLYDYLKVPEELKQLYKIHESGVYFTKNPSLQGIYKKVMKQTLQAIYSGSISIDEGLDSAQEFAEKNW